MLLLLLTALTWACDAELTSVAVDRQLGEAEAAFAKFDAEGFSTRVESVREQLPCLIESIGKLPAARLHRLEGLRLFLARDESGAAAHFGTAKRLEPGYDWPEDLLPARHKVREVYAEAASGDATSVLAEPADGELVLDGVRSAERTLDAPVVFQHLGGAERLSQLLGPTDAVPDYPVAPAPEPALSTSETSVQTKRPPVVGIGVLGGGVALGAVAAVQFARSRSQYGEYLDRFDAGDATADAYFDDKVAPPRNQAMVLGAGSAVILGTGGVLLAQGVRVKGRF